MKLRRTALAISVVFGLALSGCGVGQQVELLTTGMACARAEILLGKMTNILIQIAANPIGSRTYVKRMRELSNEVSDIRSLNDELNSSLIDLSLGVNRILDSIENPGLNSLIEIPEGIADIQGSLDGVYEKCEQLTQA